MTTETLLSWYYIVFWLPMLASALLILLSSLRLGHHHGVRHSGPGHAGGHMRVAAHSGAGHGQHGAGGIRHHTVAAARHAGAGRAAKNNEAAQITASHHYGQDNSFLGMLGAGKAPLPIVLQSFFLFWGFFGFWADRLFIQGPDAAAYRALPSLGIALVAGVLGARGTAELVARILPTDETAVMSREGLFGLTGEITFPVTETAGRIFVYDEYGTLHDESCRVASGHPAIEKGHKAIVLDCDQKGHLIVKEIA